MASLLLYSSSDIFDMRASKKPMVTYYVSLALAEKVICDSARRNSVWRTFTSRFICAITRSSASTRIAAIGILRYPRTTCGMPRPSRSFSSMREVLLLFSRVIPIDNFHTDPNSDAGPKDTTKCGTISFILAWSKAWLAPCWPAKKPWTVGKIASNCTALTSWLWMTFPYGWSRSTATLTWVTRAKSPHACAGKFWRIP